MSASLDRFHEQHAGLTSQVMARGRDEWGRSSYQLLAGLAGSGERVLDLGCGDGHLLERLTERGATAIGLDRSAAELALARRRGARAVRGEAAALPFPDAAFSLVVSHLAFSVMDGVEAIVGELARVLAPGGRFAAVVTGGPVATLPGEPNTFEAFLALLSAELGPTPRCRFGDPRAGRFEGWQALFCGSGSDFALQWTRHQLDFSGAFAEIWRTLASVYDCMLLSREARALLRAALTAWCEQRFPLSSVPLHMVVWVAIATRA